MDRLTIFGTCFPHVLFFYTSSINGCICMYFIFWCVIHLWSLQRDFTLLLHTWELQIISVLQKIMFIILPAYKSVPIPSATLVYCKSNNNNCIPLYWFISQDYWLDNVFTTQYDLFYNLSSPVTHLYSIPRNTRT